MKRFKDNKQFRYKHFDYSQNGFYFVTICTKNREMFFGDIVEGKMELSRIGKAAEKFWQEIPDHFPFARLDKYIVMPNHIHGIIVIENNAGTQNFVFPQRQDEYKNKFGPQSKNLSSIIRGFKIGVTKYKNENNIAFAWQTRFHDRIIRNEKELDNIRQYIINNPLKWEIDKDNLENLYM